MLTANGSPGQISRGHSIEVIQLGTPADPRPEQVELQMDMKKSDFDTWVKNIELVAAGEGQFVFETSNSFARDWLEKKLEEVLVDKLSPLVGGNGERKARVKFVCR